MIVIAVVDKPEVTLNSKFNKLLVTFLDLMTIFGFEHAEKFTRDEFHYFLDCLFRGLFCLLICEGHEMSHMRGSRLRETDLVFLVD